jgi:hypothetical protein
MQKFCSHFANEQNGANFDESDEKFCAWIFASLSQNSLMLSIF